MKRILAIWMLLMLVLVSTYAMAETAVDTSAVMTQVVIWVLCGVLTALGAVATWVAKSYIIPWLKDVAVPWLKQHKLLEAAKTAVEYAEAELGRHTGDEKWKLALSLLDKLGFNIDDETVVAALKAKWQELDLAQVTAGIKDTLDNNLEK